MDNNQSGAPTGNPLGEKPVGSLLLQFAVPSIISTLISSLYNIVDQVFIGHQIGYLGNAATTVAYPLTFLCGALTLLFSNGSAVNFNILNGRGKKEDAMKFAGNGLSLITLEGLILALTIGLEIPWGWIADRIGYRKSMIFCCGLYFISKLVFWRAGDY